MRNCIGKHIWDSYGHCLGSLSPTDAYISVANNEHISCTGLWSGDISLARMKFHTHFSVFDCRGVFDVILGKPWLHEARAIHYYANDTLSISTDTNTTIIGNTRAGDDVNTHTNPPAIPEPTSPTTNTKSLDDQIHAEVHRIEILQHKNGPFAESRWAQYLDVEPLMEDDDATQKPRATGVTWFTTRAEQRAIAQAKRRERQMDKRKRRTEILDWLSHEAKIVKEQQSNTTTNVYEPAADQRRRIDEDYANQWHCRRATIAIIQNLQDTDTDPLDTAATYNLVNNERQLLNLRAKFEHLRQMAAPDMNSNKDPSIHMANIVSNQEFTIDCGENNSTRISDPFATKRVNEIIEKIELGPDLTDNQREQVKSLVREYADVFALSLSEVRVVDWYRHHLDVDPSVKLSTRTSQRPISEAQKNWFFSILDEMEDAHVIQKVPGSFIKALSSTNLTPKEAGKISATRTEILRKVNTECIKHGLPPFWEEVREPGETDEAMLKAVEYAEGKEIKTKW
jgi:hypothetical protein